MSSLVLPYASNVILAQLHKIVNVTDQYVCWGDKMVYSGLAELPRQVLKKKKKKACFGTETVARVCSLLRAGPLCKLLSGPSSTLGLCQCHKQTFQI